jgi:hypothetical protein
LMHAGAWKKTKADPPWQTFTEHKTK